MQNDFLVTKMVLADGKIVIKINVLQLSGLSYILRHNLLILTTIIPYLRSKEFRQYF